MQLSIGFSSFELGTQAVQALVVFIGWADLGAWRGLIPTCSDGRPSDQGLQAANHGSGGKGSSECSWLSIAGASGASAASMIRWDQMGSEAAPRCFCCAPMVAFRCSP